jgi:hypothetical protein
MLHFSAFGKIQDGEQRYGISSLQTAWRNVVLYVVSISISNFYRFPNAFSETVDHVFPSESP